MPYDQRDPGQRDPEQRDKNNRNRLAEIYQPSVVLPDPLPADPMPLALAWFTRAHDERVQPNPNAMTLGTVAESGLPSARIVLCKRFDAERGLVVFYTNYESRKSVELAATGRASVVFHWDPLDLQIRLECRAVKSPAEESDAYYASRALESRLGAWSSNQSRPIGSREELIAQVERSAARFGIDSQDLRSETEQQADREVPRPEFWGGWRLWIERIELWAAGPGRVHDRAVWSRSLQPTGPHDFDTGPWGHTRLQP